MPEPLSSAAPLNHTQQHCEECEYADEGEGDRHGEERRLLSLPCHARDHRKVSAPEVAKPPVVFPNRNHQSHDAAEDQRKAEVAWRLGKMRGSNSRHLLHAFEKLDCGRM